MDYFKLSQVFASLALAVAIVAIFVLATSETTIAVTDCYDKFGNEILGLECEEEVYPDNVENAMLLMAISSFILFVGSVGSLIAGIGDGGYY